MVQPSLSNHVITSVTTLQFKNLGEGFGKIAVITLQRPNVANAFDSQMIQELTGHCRALTQAQSDTRLVVIRGSGKHFSAGADLGWMRAAAQLDLQGNLADAGLLNDLFLALCQLPMPTLGIVHGSVFGGAVGLISCLDSVLAVEGTRFALSEVKLGLAPAVIMPFLARRLPPAHLRRLSLTGLVFSAEDALNWNLVHQVVSLDKLEKAVVQEINALLLGSPTAQRDIKTYLNRLDQKPSEDPAFGAHMIATLRTSATGQAGLNAFFAREPPPWVHSITEDGSWTLG